MLITFKTRAHYPNVTIFGDVATQLLKLMGRKGTVPSAIAPGDIREALRQLRDGLAKQAATSPPAKPTPDDEDEDEDAEPPVSIGTRAVPLIELLEAAAREDVAVMWEHQ